MFPSAFAYVVVDIVAFFIIAAVLCIRMGFVLLNEKDLVRLSMDLEKKEPRLKNAVSNTLQLYVSAPSEGAYKPLVALAIAQGEETAAPVSFNMFLPRPLPSASVLALLAALLIALAVLATGSPRTRTTLWSLAHPFSFNGQSNEFTVVPGNATVVSDDSLIVLVTNRQNEALRLVASLSAGQPGPVTYAGMDSATITIRDIRVPFTYHIQGLYRQSPTYKVGVIRNPEIAVLQVEIHAPSYMQKSVRKLERDAGDCTAPLGSQIHLTVQGSKSLSRAVVVFSDSLKIPMDLVR